MTLYSFITWLQSTAAPLLDLLLYVSAENYNTVTSAAYTAILPWYANYTVPPKRRDLARTRTAHLGLSGLDVDTTAEEAYAPGRGTASSEYEAAKRAAGIPAGDQSKGLNMGHSKGLGGFFGGPMYAARFKLDALSSELLDPLHELLGKHDYIFRGKELSSLDCLAFGYLSLLYYPPVPQSWLKETIQTKYPSIARYIRNLRECLFPGEGVSAATVWSISTGGSKSKGDALLPWQPNPKTIPSRAWAGVREMVGNVPGIASIIGPKVVHSLPLDIVHYNSSELPSSLLVNSTLGAIAAATLGLVSLAIHHRRTVREGPLIFWAMRSTAGFGEAENILSILAPQSLTTVRY